MTPPHTIDEVRKAYLDFFTSKKHLVVPSSPLIPAGDPTLLLTSAGMVQFKDYFEGKRTPPSPRLASVQKCFRTTDIDEVGDTKHLTLFEMLGNFSIGDYFKKESIAWAWEFCTQVLHLPKERLWITVYKDDDEAEALWQAIGVPKERILRYGDKQNFWGPAGEEGPCGPCSELHYDYGEEFGKDATPAEGGERFIEIWNLVFTQFYHHRDGRRTPLPKPNIDTGMGLERTTMVLQDLHAQQRKTGKRIISAYQTDAFDYLIAKASELTGTQYGKDAAVDYAMRVLAEHSRSVTFLIGDGVVPSNEGRGYVLRRILRRAVRYARKAGVTGPFLTKMAEAVIGRMAHQYPELKEQRDFIMSIIEGEEEQFGKTLDEGLVLLGGIVERQKKAGAKVITGADVFKLYDTFGFPPDITQDVAREQGFTADLAGFEKEMEAQRQRGRAAAKFGLGDKTSPETYKAIGAGQTRFTGYDQTKEHTVVLGLIVGGAPAQRAKRGEKVEVILRQTPFYAEGGGQVGDTGDIRSDTGHIVVSSTQSPMQGFTVHLGEVQDGEIAVGDAVWAAVTADRRADVMRNHTGTHLLHAALRKVLGTHVRQAGSLVSPERLRFDFSHTSSISTTALRDIERMVNDKILANLPVAHKTMAYKEAIENGALAFFGDKYGDQVRTCRIGGDGDVFSLELCGGTHVSATGEIGLLHIESEGSIAAGTRRVEAVTGRNTDTALIERHALLEALAQHLKSSPAELSSRVSGLLEELDRERKRAVSMERELARRQAESLIAQAQTVDGVTLLTAQVSASSAESLREMGDWLKSKLGSGIVTLGALVNDKPAFVAFVTPDLTAKGYHAGNIIREVAKVAGGGGGGRPEMAQAGGKDKEKLAEALALVAKLVKKG